MKMDRSELKEATGRERLFDMDSGGVAASYCGDAALEFGGQRFEPDVTKGYGQFRLGCAFPVVTFYGMATHPAVVARNWRSMQHHVVNLMHLMKIYDPNKRQRDRVIGSVVAVEFPREPMGGWKAQGEIAKAPGMDGVCVLHKQADGVDKLIGQHLGGRHKWTVSMEVDYRLSESGFLIRDTSVNAQTPADLLELGWSYVPLLEAEDGLLESYDFKKNRMASRREDGSFYGSWKKRDTLLLKGGLEGNVHFKGMGLVEYGAEPTADLVSLVAGLDPEDTPEGRALALMNEFSDGLKSFSENLSDRC